MLAANDVSSDVSYVYTFYYNTDPPPVNDVKTSISRTPSNLSGFDIFITWTVSASHTYSTCGSVALFQKTLIHTHAYYYPLMMR